MPQPIDRINGRIFQSLNPKKFSVATNEKAQKIAKLKKIQVAHVGTNNNYFTFTEDELMNAAGSLKDKPIYINYLGVAPDDHADNSSMNSIGWSTDSWYDPEDQTLYANADVTTPTVVDKLERVDSKGRRELNFVSMSCDAVPICSICGSIFTDCDHERGQTYEGKQCSVIGKEVSFRNFVLTNEPADPNAVIGEVAIENACLQKKGVSMKKNEKAQEVEQKPPELEEKKTASVEDMVAGIHKQLAEMDTRIAALETKSTTETPPETSAENKPDEEKEKKPVDVEVTDEEKKKKEETSAAGNAPLPNPPADASPPAMSDKEAKPTDVTPPATPEGKQPATMDVKKPVDKLPDGSEIDNKPKTVESVPEVDKLKNEVSTLKKENATFRAREIREGMKEFASKKKELISLGHADIAEKVNTAKELDFALEVARKSNVSTRREKYSGSDLPKYADSRGDKISEDAGKVKIDLSKKGGAIAAIREAASKK